jgi:signal transduction histidine kinase/ActR/RegA family two-component response regulator
MAQASSIPAVEFRDLFESVPGLYLALVPASPFTILAASDGFLRATMTRREQIVGRSLLDIFPENPADSEVTGIAALRASLERTLKKRIPDTMPVQIYEIRRPASEGGGFEARYWRPQNSPVLGADGAVRYIIHRVEDVTEFTEASRRLQAQLGRLELLNHITRGIAARHDLRSIFQVVLRNIEDNLPIDFGCIGLSDPAGKTLTIAAVGLKHPELGGTGRVQLAVEQNGLARAMSGEIIYEADISTLAWPFAQRLASAGLRSLAVIPLMAESTVFGVLVAVRGTPDGFSMKDCEFLRQLSEHVALASHQSKLHDTLQDAYNDLRRSREAMVQQERLRALGQMASGIAHDINNAISPASLYMQSLLEREPNLSDRVRSQLATVMRALDDVAATVARMREFYRPREGEMTLRPVAVNSVVQQVIALTEVRWRDQPQERGVVVDMNVELGTDLPEIMAAENEIRDALTNLIFNAVDAMPNGGAITLRTAVIPGPQDPMERRVVIEVRDTGVGMDDETRRRCLEPFFTTKGERGTGLGLAMVYGAVERHSAQLEIESVPNQGTTIRLVFPTPAREGSSAERKPSTAKPARPLRILIVDDDPLVIDSLRETLIGDGHSVITASGGQAGIEAFARSEMSGEPIDALVTDLGMPYVDGRQVAAAVRAAAPGIAIILMTGWGQRLIAENDIPKDVDRVLAKPPKLAELRSTLAELTTAA